jgi:hypothetical protein
MHSVLGRFYLKAFSGVFIKVMLCWQNDSHCLFLFNMFDSRLKNQKKYIKRKISHFSWTIISIFSNGCHSVTSRVSPIVMSHCVLVDCILMLKWKCTRNNANWDKNKTWNLWSFFFLFIINLFLREFYDFWKFENATHYYFELFTF